MKNQPAVELDKPKVMVKDGDQSLSDETTSIFKCMVYCCSMFKPSDEMEKRLLVKPIIYIVH